MTDEGPIRVVLDASAVIAYAKGSVSVGETIAEVLDERGVFAVPAVCLIEAAHAVADVHLRLLTAHHACRVLPLRVEDWPALASGVRVLGRLDLAAALRAASAADGYVLTADPDAYGEDGGQAVIPI